MTKPEVITKYDELLAKTGTILAARKQRTWVETLSKWRTELKNIRGGSELQRHAARTAKALAGMESIGEIALANNDQEFLNLVKALYQVCRQISDP